MFALIRKDLWRIYGLPLILLAAQTGYWFLSRHALDEGMVRLYGYLGFVIALVTIVNAEQYEDRYRGYSLLRTLPIRLGCIVAGRFAAVLSLIILITLYGMLLLWLFPDPGNLAWQGRLTLLAFANVTLLVCAAFLVAIYFMGFSFFFRIALIVVTVGLLLAAVIGSRILVRMGHESVPDPIGAVASIDWLAASAASLVLFAAAAVLAVRGFRRRDVG
jgi:hypothetical protein